MDANLLDQLHGLLRPIATRLANTVATAVVQLVNDATKLQLLQVGVLDDEDVEDAEHHQPYGFSSVPLAGAEAISLFPSGDRARPLVVAVSDRRYRPTGGEPGQVDLYHYLGARLVMLKDGTVEIRSKLGLAQSTLKGQTYRTAEDTMFTALQTFLAAQAVYNAALGALPGMAGPAATVASAASAVAAAIGAFQAAASTYLTTVMKVE